MNRCSWICEGSRPTKWCSTNPRFATSVGSFAAAITKESLSDIVGEDVRQHRRTRWLALVMVLLFFSLLIALLISLYALFRLKGQP